MTTKGHIKKVRRVHGIIRVVPQLAIIDEFKDEPLALKLYIFRGNFSRLVNDVMIPIWFA